MSRNQPLLRSFLTVFGLVCVGIALAHIAVGPASIPGAVPVNATMDSEDRFYASLFLGFGLAHIWAARDLPSRKGIVLALQAVFFVGGLARIVSLVAVGPPAPLFVFLGALELLIPPLVWRWSAHTA
ncbi:MAG: DUF4345 domain-containing protein [Novosphingobium sp.]|uniref:DUF4345 domain-containing protein n=1 Tax=Novosphingobium sp. TaxID=1874826 RepID=UPI0017FFB5DA|nr:DUF4345 domain-containing protein [Novosphingobium sp.]